jgi:hypothetical protein
VPAAAMVVDNFCSIRDVMVIRRMLNGRRCVP